MSCVIAAVVILTECWGLGEEDLITYFYTRIIPFNQHVCYYVNGESNIALLSTSFCSMCLCNSSLVVETLHYLMENVNNIYFFYSPAMVHNMRFSFISFFNQFFYIRLGIIVS